MRGQKSSSLLSRWERWTGIDPGASEAGFIGSIPYLLLLRVLILGGIGLRFAIHRAEYTRSQWTVVMALIGVTAALAIIKAYVTVQYGLRHLKQVQAFFVGSDILLISAFYFLTRNTQSDFFLFYYLPIFTAAEYLGTRAMLVAAALTMCAFGGVLMLLLPIDPDPTLTYGSLLSRVFLPRGVFFVSVIMTSSFLLGFERSQRKKASQREAEIQTLLECKSRVDQLFDLDQVLDCAISEAVKIVGAIGGHISLVNYETSQLETRSRIPDGDDYLKKNGPLDMGNGLAEQVVQLRRAHYVEDVRSDPVLRNVFGLKVRTLLCVPIIAHNTVLGLLGVGGTAGSLSGNDHKRFLQVLASQIASAIERARLLIALSEIGGTVASALELDSCL